MRRDLIDFLTLQLAENKAGQTKRYYRKKYQKFCDKTQKAKSEMDLAWKEKAKLKKIMLFEKAKQNSDPNFMLTWRAFRQFSDSKNDEMRGLLDEANKLHELSLQEFAVADEQLTSSTRYAHKRKAFQYQRKADELNNRANEIVSFIAEAHAKAEAEAPFSSDFILSRQAYEDARKKHGESVVKYKALKAQRNLMKNNYDNASRDYLTIKDQLDKVFERIDFGKCFTNYRS